VEGDKRHSRPPEIGLIRAPIVLAHEQAFEIGNAEFHPATREVRFASQTTILEPRVMQMLIALHRAGGAVVNKDDLLQSCWEGRIVGEDAINRVVSRLRGVAEKDAGRQFRIETITKVGYRLVSASGEPFDARADGPPTSGRVTSHWTAFVSHRSTTIAVTGLLLLVLGAAAWWWLRPAPAAAHSMMIRLTGFRVLSADLPSTLHESINAEVAAALNADGVISVSTVPNPTPGVTHSLGGTIYRDGGSVRVITRLVNEQSGVVLWSERTEFAADQVSKVPHKIAVNAGTVIRCGLSGAATYRKSLPDPVLSNYMQYCQHYWSYDASQTLQFARRVVAAVPDFSWGWSALGNGFMQAANAQHDRQRAEALRAAGRRAEDQALALDSGNSEALAHKAYLIDPRDWVAQEALFKSAIAAKPLDCGCEHYGYGLKLESVGRIGAAVEQFRAATDMLALWPDSQLALARALEAAGQGDQAKPYFDAAIDTSRDPDFAKRIAIAEGTETGDFASAIAALRDPQLQIPKESRAALSAGYEALISAAPEARMKAIHLLSALPGGQKSDIVATMLGALGANRAALQAAAETPWLFWRRSMRGVLNEPDFPAVARQLGLITYWKTSGHKPDICRTRSEPPFCRLI
jgi:DNA-binding winged helix-turn-helix (wHTH) protein/tetratricopeptide (TPR) repeat protein